MGLCCCMSLRKGVFSIGVISVLSSAVFVVMNLVTSVTFEEHVSACRQNAARDALKVFPACDVLTDASLLMAGRIFIYIQLFVWVTEIVVSIFLVVAAAKKRSSYMIPWIVVSILVIIILSWNIYQAALGQNLLHLLLLICSLVVSIYFLIIVRSFGKTLTRSSHCCPSSVEHHTCSRPVPSFQSCCEYSKPPKPIPLDYPPPAYTPFVSNKKGPMPENLGIKY